MTSYEIVQNQIIVLATVSQSIGDNPRPHTIHHARPVRVFYCLLVILATTPHQHPTHYTPHAQATAPTGQRGGRVAKI